VIKNQKPVLGVAISVVHRLIVCQIFRRCWRKIVDFTHDACCKIALPTSLSCGPGVLSVTASLEKSRNSLQKGVGAEPLFMLHCDRCPVMLTWLDQLKTQQHHRCGTQGSKARPLQACVLWASACRSHHRQPKFVPHRLEPQLE
jgi:hypothetical protein